MQFMPDAVAYRTQVKRTQNKQRLTLLSCQRLLNRRPGSATSLATEIVALKCVWI